MVHIEEPESISDILGQLAEKQRLQSTQKKNNDDIVGICYVCKENSVVKNKILHGKKYTKICQQCFNEISFNKKSQSQTLNIRIRNRKAWRENVPKRFIDSNLNQFDKAIRKKIIGVSSYENILIWGKTPGTGKTHLMFAAVRRYAHRSKQFLYYNINDLMIKLRDSFRGDNERDEKSLIDKLKSINVLVLDDIGVEKSSDYTIQTIYTIIDYRYNEMMPTIFTSNLDPNELSEKLGDRIASRICSGIIIKLDGKDRRL